MKKKSSFRGGESEEFNSLSNSPFLNKYDSKSKENGSKSRSKNKSVRSKSKKSNKSNSTVKS